MRFVKCCIYCRFPEIWQHFDHVTNHEQASQSTFSMINKTANLVIRQMIYILRNLVYSMPQYLFELIKVAGV